MPHEGETKPDLSKYYPVSQDISMSELPEITLENLSKALFLLGLIAFMINALMVYLFVRQEWAMRYPLTTFAQIGITMMLFGGILYLVNRKLEKKGIL
jgi:hypothetical protein